MATIAGVLTGPTNDGIVEVLWETLTATNDEGSGIALAKYPDKTVQVIGNFSGAADVSIEGSNDDGTTWFELRDSTGTVLGYTSANGDIILENPKLIRPKVASGDGSTDIDVYIVARAD